MAHPYHHALSSVAKWGGIADDYLPLHSWFDQSKRIIADYRHRALRHHAEGIFMAETLFGPTLRLSTGRIIPVRWIGEQHVREDLGRIPSFADWARAIRPEPWMGRATSIDIADVARGGAMTRFSNASRAALAKSALETFLHTAYCGRSTSELHTSDLRDAIADLVADLGHYVDRRFRKRTPFTDLVSRGVGIWSAERRYRCQDPEDNHHVRIVIAEGGEP